MRWRERAVRKLGGERFDLLVVGGGATGAGIALDAAARGLKVALVERSDFAQGTSSRSTKLLHGGVRYLEAAVKTFDAGQLRLVRSALRERRTLLDIAPHLTRTLPLLTPLYQLWEIPYYLTGLKLYDLLSGGRFRIGASSFLSKERTLELVPGLNAEGLRGSVRYYDGQFDDARMVIAILRSAAERGAVLVNHAGLVTLAKSGGRVVGGTVRDELSGEEVEVAAKVVINATGPHADEALALDDPDAPPILTVSAGAHVVLAGDHLPHGAGLLVPRTDDGRVIFMLPWHGHTLVGTTDTPAEATADPQASEADVDYLLEHASRYLRTELRRSEVKAAWSGLRPLLRPRRHESGTAAITRDHLLEKSPSGLLTITGGKWTTYRQMAEEAVDYAIQIGELSSAGPCTTAALPLSGAEGWSPGGAARLAEEFDLPPDVAAHLDGAYGTNAREVAQLAADQGLTARLHPDHPYLEAEVPYTLTREFAVTADDVLSRRLRLGFLDEAAYADSLKRVEELIGNEDRPDSSPAMETREA